MDPEYEDVEYINNGTDDDDDDNYYWRITEYKLEMARIIWLSLFIGIFAWLMLWALVDMAKSGKLKNDFFVKIFFVFSLFLVWDLVEYFIFYDYYFFKNVTYTQWLAYLVEFMRCLQRTLVFGLGTVELVRLSSVSSTASSLNSLRNSWLLLLSVGFFFPAGLLAFHATLEHHSILANVIEYSIIPLLISAILFFWCYSYAKRLSFHFNLEEIAGCKLILTLLLVILVESAQFLVLEEVFVALQSHIRPHHFWTLLSTVREGLHDVNRLLPPLAYLLLFRQEHWAANKWLPAINNPSLLRMMGQQQQESYAERSRAQYDAELNALVFSEIDNC